MSDKISVEPVRLFPPMVPYRIWNNQIPINLPEFSLAVSKFVLKAFITRSSKRWRGR